MCKNPFCKVSSSDQNLVFVYLRKGNNVYVQMVDSPRLVGQISVLFTINRGCTKGHSWSYDSHRTCSYTTIAFPIYVETLRSLLSNYPSTIHYLLNVETLPSLLSNYPSTIHYPTSSLRLIRPRFWICGLSVITIWRWHLHPSFSLTILISFLFNRANFIITII